MAEQARAGKSFDGQGGGGSDTEPAAGKGFPIPGEGKSFDPLTGGGSDTEPAAGKGFPVPGKDD